MKRVTEKRLSSFLISNKSFMIGFVINDRWEHSVGVRARVTKEWYDLVVKKKFLFFTVGREIIPKVECKIGVEGCFDFGNYFAFNYYVGNGRDTGFGFDGIGDHFIFSLPQSRFASHTIVHRPEQDLEDIAERMVVDDFIYAIERYIIDQAERQGFKVVIKDRKLRNEQAGN